MADRGSPLILPQGVNGAVIRFADRLTDAANRAALAFRAGLEQARPTGMEESASALASVFVRYDPGATSFEALEADLRARLEARDFHAAPLPQDRRRWTIPAVFGGDAAPGLAHAAEAAGISPEEAVRDLTAKPVRVLAIGFAPGQPYLGELDPRWDIPRLPDLIEVPEGALVLAIRQFVLFANPSPTGWTHIAQTGFRCFRAEADDPFALKPGDEVLFRPVDAPELQDLSSEPEGGATCEALP
jgi:inhibitor of KinA